MAPRLSSLIARLRDHVQADGAGAGLLDPLLRAATVERGKTWATWAYVRRRGLTAGGGPFRGLRYPPPSLRGSRASRAGSAAATRSSSTPRSRR